MLVRRSEYQPVLTVFDKVQGRARVCGGNQSKTTRGCFQEDYAISIFESREDEYVGRGVVSWQFVLVDKTCETYPADTQALNERLQLGVLRARANNRKADGPPDRTHCGQSPNEMHEALSGDKPSYT